MQWVKILAVPRRYTDFFNQELGGQSTVLFAFLRHFHIARGAIRSQEGPAVRIPFAPAGRCYGVGGEEMALSLLQAIDGAP
jgi:hypothetical protein